MKYFKKLHRKFEEILETDVSAHRIAWSFALGVFLAVLPTFGFAPILGVGLSIFIKRIHTISMIASFIIFNPLVLAILYTVSYQVGTLIFNQANIVEVWLFPYRFMIGNLIVAFVVSLASYSAVIHTVLVLRHRHYRLTQIK